MVRRGWFSLSFLCVSVTLVLSDLFVRHVTPDPCTLSHSLLRRGVVNKECELPVIPGVDAAAARDHGSTWSACSLSSAALLMIAGPLVTD